MNSKLLLSCDKIYFKPTISMYVRWQRHMSSDFPVRTVNFTTCGSFLSTLGWVLYWAVSAENRAFQWIFFGSPLNAPCLSASAPLWSPPHHKPVNSGTGQMLRKWKKETGDHHRGTVLTLNTCKEWQGKTSLWLLAFTLVVFPHNWLRWWCKKTLGCSQALFVRK